MAKPTTTYTPSTADSTATKTQLNSTTVRLNSTSIYLNGYTTINAPNQLSNKPLTTFTAV